VPFPVIPPAARLKDILVSDGRTEFISFLSSIDKDGISLLWMTHSTWK